jgi:hypothetical protein
VNCFQVGQVYELRDILLARCREIGWQPDQTWATDYFKSSDNLVTFVDLDFSFGDGVTRFNEYDPLKGALDIISKPGAHLAQITLKALIDGKLNFEIFAKFDSLDCAFIYFGLPTISAYQENVWLNSDVKSVRFNLIFPDSTKFEKLSVAGEGLTDASEATRLEGDKYEVVLTKYERDPYLRAACIRLMGSSCKICGFDFGQAYGPLGEDYCQVHHIVPLSEVGRGHKVDPRCDLIPVCANCHAMLHRSQPALKPSELRSRLDRTYLCNDID